MPLRTVVDYQHDDIIYTGTVEKALVRYSTGAKEYIASFNDSALPFNPLVISWCLLLTEQQALMARTDYATRTKTQQKEEAEQPTSSSGLDTQD